MSSLKSPKTPKPPKLSKSSKSGKEMPSLQFTCKYRGKYDLSKNKKNTEYSLANAVNLFEGIFQKSENLYKNSQIKMFREQKMFYFVEPKSLSKSRHHFQYSQVRKFFVLHKDPTILIMGVHHKTHRWFLVFQFISTDDLKRFCDEIESEIKELLHEKDTYDEIGANHTEYDEMDSAQSHAPEILGEGNLKKDSIINNDYFEKISIHSDKYNEVLEAGENNMYLVPDLSTENLCSQSSFMEETISAMSSSRNSLTSELDEKYYCDNHSKSRLRDMLISSGNVFSEFDDWEEQLTCMEYSKKFLKPLVNKIGPIYLYYARHKQNYEENIIRNYSTSYPSDEEDNCSFDSYNAKFIRGGENRDRFQSHEPKMISKENDLDNFYDHDPKMNHSDFNGLENHEPMIGMGDYMNHFEIHEPKMTY